MYNGINAQAIRSKITNRIRMEFITSKQVDIITARIPIAPANKDVSATV
jgi:hypothetical protein